MIRNKNAAFGIFVALFMVFWNAADFLYATWISGSGYRFSAGSDLLAPLAAAVTIGYLLFLRKGKNKE